MKKLLFLSIQNLLFIGLLSSQSFYPFDTSQIVLNLSDISPEYSKYFYENKNKIVDVINQKSFNISTRPLRIEFKYKGGVGMIVLSILYEKETFLDSTSEQGQHYRSWSRMYSNFVSLWGVSKLMAVINYYKLSVALSADNNKTIADAILCVKLLNKEGTRVNFYGVSTPNSNNIYEFQLLRYGHTMRAKDKTFITFYTQDEYVLNDRQIFILGKPFGIDGKPSEYYQVYKFFNFPISK